MGDDKRFERIDAQLARLEAKLDEVLQALEKLGATAEVGSIAPPPDSGAPPGGRLFEPSELGDAAAGRRDDEAE